MGVSLKKDKKAKEETKPEKTIEALILEGAEYSSQIKELEKKLEVIKQQLKERGIVSAGNHIGYDNSVLKITDKDTFINPEPKELHQKLKELRKGSLFWKCITVQTKSSVEALGDELFRSLQTKGKVQKAYSFSK